MILIVETVEEVEIIREAKENGTPSNYFIAGPFMESDQINRNGRIYPRGLMEREVARYTQDYILTNRAVGELSHPNRPSVDPDRISHKILSLHHEGNTVYGKAKILHHMPCGAIVKNLIDEGVKIGVSSRGLGTITKKSSGNFVNDDFQLATVDIVLDPSARSAFVDSITEGKNWELIKGVWVQQDIEIAQKTLSESKNRKDYESKAMQMFSKFLKNL